MGELVNQTYIQLDRIEKSISDLRTQNREHYQTLGSMLTKVRENMVTKAELSGFLNELNSCITGQLPALREETAPPLVQPETAAPSAIPEPPLKEEPIPQGTAQATSEAKQDAEETGEKQTLEKPKEEPKKRRFFFLK